jgi:hypothetical protein
MMEVFSQSPRLYQGKFITREFESESTDAMDFGKAAHALLLESSVIYEVIPANVLSKSGSKTGAAWKEYEASRPGKLLLKADQADLLSRMGSSLAEHPIASDIVNAPGRREVVVRWTDEDTGVAMKCRIDAMRDTFRWIADMKSTATIDEREWSRTALRLGYHRQAALYTDAVFAIAKTGPEFYFIPMLKEPPYTVDVFQLSELFLDMGRRENEALLREFVRRRDANDWSERGYGLVKTIEPPDWAARDFFKRV